MKKFTAVLFVLSLFLTSCAGNSATAGTTGGVTTSQTTVSTKATTSTVNEEAPTYTMEYEGDSAYVVFNDAFKVVGGGLVPSLEFASFAEMRDAFLNGNFSKNQLLTIAQFPENEKGIRVINAKELYVPVVPEALVLSYVSISGGNGYYAKYLGKNEINNMSFKLYDSKELYETEFNNDWDLSKNSNITILSTEKTEDRNAEIIYNKSVAADLKNVRYTIEKDGLTLFVDEIYALKHYHDDTLKVSDTVPISIKIYGTDGKKYFQISMSSVEERPSYEFISSFGIKKYE